MVYRQQYGSSLAEKEKSPANMLSNLMHNIAQLPSHMPSLPHLPNAFTHQNSTNNNNSQSTNSPTGRSPNKQTGTQSPVADEESAGHSTTPILARRNSSGTQQQPRFINRIKVVMYNFGSPRVGNHAFAQIYNKEVRNSLFNHFIVFYLFPSTTGASQLPCGC
jgi:hypothetical protein